MNDCSQWRETSIGDVRDEVAPAGEAIALGSDMHQVLFCRTLIDTHNPYRPAAIEWPLLGPDERDRLVSLPIWDIAIQTEAKASRNVRSYATETHDELLREAVLLNAAEEARHKSLLSYLVSAYGIMVQPEPAYEGVGNPEWAFLVTGFSECIDSVFAFGLFDLAERSGYFPPELVEIFEPVMQEEARHILFFVNWLAWHRRNLAWWRRPRFETKVAAVWLYLLLERIGVARDLGSTKQSTNFTVAGSKSIGVEITTGGLISVCLAANERRLARYDSRLLRPSTVPWLMRRASRFLRQPASVS